MKDNMNTKATESTTNTWLTPRWLIDALGEFDLDPCAAPEPRAWSCAKRNISRPDDGLAHEWSGRVWLNPPYGKEIEPFMRRMSEHKKGLALTFMRSDSRWFQDFVLAKAAFLFLFRGRLRFSRQDGFTPPQSANAASCLIAYDFTEYDVVKMLENKGFGKLVLLRF